MSPFNVLLVDDDRRLLEAMKTGLAQDFEVATASSPAKALEIMQKRTIDAAVLDIEMPVMNGLELMPRLKAIRPDCRFLFLTCFKEDSIYIRSLNLGVDDFLIKPVTPVRLKAAIQHRLRPPVHSPKPRFGELLLDPDSGHVDHGKERIALTRKEQQILLALMLSKEHAVPRDQLVREIWGEISISPHALDTHITNLRRKLSSAGVRIHIGRDRFVHLSEN